MEGTTDLIFNGMALRIEWLWEDGDEYGHEPHYFLQDSFVYDDEGQHHHISLPDSVIPEIEEAIAEIEQRNIDMDREP